MNFLACPDLFRSLYAVHDYRHEVARACDMAQGFTGDLAWFMKQSCLSYYVASGTSRYVISGKPSESRTGLLTLCPALASLDTSGSKGPNSEIFFQDQQRRLTECHIMLFLLIL